MAGFPKKIFIIDDDEHIREITHQALQIAGDIDIKSCASCDEALGVLNEGAAPDLVLLDLKMPDKDGTDTIRELRKLDAVKGTPIIFVTGIQKVAMMDEYKALGVLGVIHKPFLPSKFVGHIQKMWQEHSYSEETA